MADFLTNRRQRVKLASDCVSEWSKVFSGVPQGTRLGPWLFVLMLNDLQSEAKQWKFVDDLTVMETIKRSESSNIQSTLNYICQWSIENKFTLHPTKCKELRFSFQQVKDTFNPLMVGDNLLDVVSHAKILGVIISNDLKWNLHVDNIIKKASKKLYFLIQLKRAGVHQNELVLFYSACIRSCIEYAAPVFHYALPTFLCNNLERVQKRACKIILGYGNYSSYDEALVELNLPSLVTRRESLCRKLFTKTRNDKSSKLFDLLPPEVTHSYSLRKPNLFNQVKFNTNRFGNTFIMKCARHKL